MSRWPASACAWPSSSATSPPPRQPRQTHLRSSVASSLDVLDANDKLYQADVGMADAHGRLGIARVHWTGLGTMR